MQAVLIRELAGPLIDLKCGSKPGAVTFATQSFQRCRLKNVADMSYVTVTECHFGLNFQNFELKMHIPVVQRLSGDPIGPKECPNQGSMIPKTAKNHRAKNDAIWKVWQI